MRADLQSIAVAVLLGLCLAGSAFAASPLPFGPTVVSGQAMFPPNSNFLLQNKPGAVINWQTPSIGKGEVTRFYQPSGGSQVRNRVIGADPSMILGSLQSNGRVFLMNPAGIVFPTQFLIEANDGSVVASPAGALTLAPGQSMTFSDPKSPDLKIQVTAPQNRAVDVGQLMGIIGNKGVASALSNRAATANTAVIGENGNIVLKFVQ